MTVKKLFLKKLTNNPEDVNKGEMSRFPIRQGANVWGGGASVPGLNAWGGGQMTQTCF